PTGNFAGAIVGLKKLIKSQGISTVKAAYAEAFCDAARKNWVKTNQATLTQSHICVKTLKGQRCNRVASCERFGLAGWDHVSLWRRKGKPPIFVMQPYAMRTEDLR